MLGWIALSALICIVCATLGFGSALSLSPGLQGVILLVLALAAMVLLGAFEAYEAQGRKREDA